MGFSQETLNQGRLIILANDETLGITGGGSPYVISSITFSPDHKEVSIKGVLYQAPTDQ